MNQSICASLSHTHYWYEVGDVESTGDVLGTDSKAFEHVIMDATPSQKAGEIKEKVESNV